MTKVYDRTDPVKLNRAFLEAFNLKDINGLLSLYAPKAVYFDGKQSVSDPQILKEELQALLDIPGTMDNHVKFHVINGNISLLHAQYRIKDGKSIITSGEIFEVACRQSDGSWLYHIDSAPL